MCAVLRLMLRAREQSGMAPDIGAVFALAGVLFFAPATGRECLAAPLEVSTPEPLVATSDESFRKTAIRDLAAYHRLLGRHRFSLQWISWDYFGVVNVTESDGTLRVKGEQKSREGNDYVRIDGLITAVDAKEFALRGSVITKVSHINGGEPCTRAGDMTFRITGNRQYWRLKEMDNPCDAVADYVDIFFH
jgi:hypothetical protein